ncbi:omptin family outer membrane protease [Treponema sp. HNW]|uniref:omptin family outer membrane protease n=1 Tax=Treponema sp. HNW TaxID=3116654 RepID=UPI003D103B1B
MKAKPLRLFAFILLLNLCSASFIRAQNSDTRGGGKNPEKKEPEKKTSISLLNPWFSALDISLVNSASYLTIGEFVYKKNPEGKKIRLSRLDWDKILMWKIGVNLNCDIKRWRIFFGSAAAVPLFHTAFVEDRDWKTSPDVLSDFSQHPVRLDSHFDIGTALVYRIWEPKTFSAGAGAGFEYIKTEITGYDGEKTLPVSDKKKLSGDVIAYKQELYLPWITGFVEWKPRPIFETVLCISFSPVTFAQALDTHYRYNPSTGISLKPTIGKEFLDRMYGFAGVKGDLVFRFNIAGKAGRPAAEEKSAVPPVRHAAELRLNALYLPELNGKTYKRVGSSMPFAYYKEYAAGTSYRSFGISLAYCIRMR